MAKADPNHSRQTPNPLPEDSPLLYRRMLPYLIPLKGRFFLGIMLGIAAACFNAVLLMSFQVIFSLVLRGQSTTLGKTIDLPFGIHFNLADSLGLAADTPVGLTGVIIACAFIPVLLFTNGGKNYWMGIHWSLT